MGDTQNIHIIKHTQEKNYKWKKHLSKKEMGETQNIHIIKQTQGKKTMSFDIDSTQQGT